MTVRTIWTAKRTAKPAFALLCATLLFAHHFVSAVLLAAPRFGQIDPVACREQAAVFPVYLSLALLSLASIEITGRGIERFGIRNAAIATIAVALASAGVMAAAFCGLILPMYLALTGKAYDGPFETWYLTWLAGTMAFASMHVSRTFEQQRDQALALRLESEALATALDQAELAILEAQIEPHFLFNTLAHIRHQYQSGAAGGDAMLDLLADYLDRALPALRSREWTVGQEIGLVRVYLQILAQRFGARLQFTITLDERLAAMRIPALVVATLADNAVRHGIAPLAGGGTIRIAAAGDARHARIDVIDDGKGLQQASGSGIGLASVRSRLRLAFGGAAMLVVEPHAPAGVRASIIVEGARHAA